MSSSNRWVQQWEDALSRLSTGLMVQPTTGSSRRPRASQLDAQELDEELVTLLKEPVRRALALLTNSGVIPFEPEMLLLLKSLLFKFSVWDHSSSYGTKLQGLYYKPTPPLPRLELSRRPLLLLFLCSILLPYSYSRLESYALSNSWPDLPSDDIRRRLWTSLSVCETGYTSMATASFIFFLVQGRYRNLSERIAQVSLTPLRPSSSREISYDYMNRQMAWHAFTEFLLFSLPLLPWKRLFRAFKKRAANRLAAFKSLHAITKLPSSNSDAFAELPDTQCAICVERSSGVSIARSIGTHLIQTPYTTSCGHRYCYFCISEKVLQAADEGDYWACLRCNCAVYSILREQELNYDEDMPSSGDH